MSLNTVLVPWGPGVVMDDSGEAAFLRTPQAYVQQNGASSLLRLETPILQTIPASERKAYLIYQQAEWRAANFNPSRTSSVPITGN